MPTTRSGRESSPAKSSRDSAQPVSQDDDRGSLVKAQRSSRQASPQKATPVAPTRFSARLRSTSPFADVSSTPAPASSASSSLPVIAEAAGSSGRSSPRKKASPTKRSQRSPSKSSSSSAELHEEDHFASATSSQEVFSQLVAGSTSKNTQLNPRAPVKDANVAAAAGSITQEAAETSQPDLRSASPATGALPATAADHDDRDEQDGISSDSSSSTSSSATDSDSDSDLDSTSDESDVDAGAVDLAKLLQASSASYKSRSERSTAAMEKAFGQDEDLISFAETADVVDAKGKATKKVPAAIDKARAKLLTGKPSKAISTSAEAKIAVTPRVKNLDQHIENLDRGKLSGDPRATAVAGGKKPDVATAGKGWFDMPEFGASNAKLQANTKRSAVEAGKSSGSGGDARVATAEQLRKEVQAIRLRNALDPKRFYRGGAKDRGMPKFAQIGTIIASPLEPKSVMGRRERGRTVVEELIRDAEASAYAKRKFAESQDRSASGRQNYAKGKRPRQHK